MLWSHHNRLTTWCRWSWIRLKLERLTIVRDRLELGLEFGLEFGLKVAGR
ncbi:MAG: hypothetical protein NVSMB57_12650 [Actinomycetota bacterium]